MIKRNAKGQFAKGGPSSMAGRKHSAETKAKMRLAWETKKFSDAAWANMMGGLKLGHGWFKGKPRSEEVKKKISKGQKGNRNSPATEFKRGRGGELSPNWKGGVTPINTLLRGSEEYKKWRTLVFERDNFTCVVCGKTGYIQAHHIKSFGKYPELRFDVDNGATMCKECHMETDNYGCKNLKEVIRL